MSRNYYAEIHLHMVWHTKSSLPLLTPDVEEFVHRYIRGRVINTAGAFVHEIGGIDTHVHVVVSIAPTILISEFVGQLKGSSSHQANKQFGLRGKVLEWQDGYGVVSFGTKNLEWVKHYVRNQREHHSKGTLVDRLEHVATPETTGSPEMAEAQHREAP